ncbi:MAG: hypothetical protein P8N61_10865, partial [Porticoccaceae bacterium]|nr:hypothetical protein [Porticoccaceae bacterium]
EAVVETKRQHTEKYISTANKRLTLRIPSKKGCIPVAMGAGIKSAARDFVTRERFDGDMLNPIHKKALKIYRKLPLFNINTKTVLGKRC